MAVFLFRPWEQLFPWLSVFPVEKAVGVVVILRVLFDRHRKLSLALPIIGLLAFGVSLGVACALSVEPLRSWIVVEEIFKWMIFSTCVAWALWQRRDLEAWLASWVMLFGIYQAKALWEYFVHGRGVQRMGIWRLIGIESTFGDPNSLAAKTVLLLPFILTLMVLTRRRWFRWILLALVGQAGLVVVLTGSRAGIIGLALAALLIPLMIPETRRVALALGMVGAVAIALWLPQRIILRYETLLHPELNWTATASVEGRKAGFWKGLWLWRRFPVAGIGPGCFVVSRPHVGPIPGEVPGLQPHNLPGQILGETGTVGLLGFTIFVIAFVVSWRDVRRAAGVPGRYLQERGRSGRTARMRVQVFADAVGTSFLLMFFFGIPGHNAYQYNWGWLAAGMAVACRSVGARCAGARSRRSGKG